MVILSFRNKKDKEKLYEKAKKMEEYASMIVECLEEAGYDDYEEDYRKSYRDHEDEMRQEYPTRTDNRYNYRDSYRGGMR